MIRHIPTAWRRRRSRHRRTWCRGCDVHLASIDVALHEHFVPPLVHRVEPRGERFLSDHRALLDADRAILGGGLQIAGKADGRNSSAATARAQRGTGSPASSSRPLTTCFRRQIDVSSSSCRCTEVRAARARRSRGLRRRDTVDTLARLNERSNLPRRRRSIHRPRRRRERDDDVTGCDQRSSIASTVSRITHPAFAAPTRRRTSWRSSSVLHSLHNPHPASAARARPVRGGWRGWALRGREHDAWRSAACCRHAG